MLNLCVYSVPPSRTILSTSSGKTTKGFAEVIDGKSYTFECLTVDVYPSAAFTWMLQNKTQVADNQTHRTNTDSRLLDFISFLTLKPSFSSNHNDRLSCSAFAPGDPTSETSTHVFLDVKGKKNNNYIYVVV